MTLGYCQHRCSRSSPREPPGLARSSFPKNVRGWGYTPLIARLMTRNCHAPAGQLCCAPARSPRRWRAESMRHLCLPAAAARPSRRLEGRRRHPSVPGGVGPTASFSQRDGGSEVLERFFCYFRHPLFRVRSTSAPRKARGGGEASSGAGSAQS
ncbi:unnamed protein product [Rangifer tarandus platyrhynchus]|uniref:Uncharacterized protein n=2 Tax=Rangifer tarandus platyrhynchus TaxID=3082113 RepID=A0ABN8YV10_RANTA|nr:unnamed protein product [Rangifer tarandus platyrhynchus]CAI9701749.1 unnamed protein product [Rangifer tarandus platyrhynchus]